MTPGLDVVGLHAGYGKSRVLHGATFAVGEGEIVCLLGRNGSGRSTAVKAVMGLVDADGAVVWCGAPILGLRPFEIARLGIGYVPETRDAFPTLSVEQNLRLGAKPGDRGADVARRLDDAYRAFPRLAERRRIAAGALSGGEQQMLALARTLIGDPALILVDEPTEGLAPALVEQVAASLCDLRRRGVAVLLVEQKLAIALDVATRCLVMGRGRIVFDGTPDALRADAAVRREWLEV